MKRHHNDGLRKRCGCSRRAWTTCAHPWHFNHKVRGGPHYRFLLDTYAEEPIRTRDEARAERDRLRGLIRRGAFPPVTAPAPVTEPAALTFEAFTTLWRSRVRSTVKKRQAADDASIVRVLCAAPLHDTTLGATPIGRLTEDDLEAIFATFVTRSASRQNKYRGALLQVQRFGVKKGYLARPWLREDTTERHGAIPHRRPGRRHRRLHSGEEAGLLAHASPWLYGLIIAALDTCARRGELLTLTWRDVSFDRGELQIRPEHSKTGIGRTIPLTARLAALLHQREHDPAGEKHTATAHVFGNAIGEKVSSPKKAWETLVLRAHGHAPVWEGRGRLSQASRAILRTIGLHFHDLRHEGASRLLEAGVPISHVQAWLGHASIATTGIYLNATTAMLHDSLKQTGQHALHGVAREADATIGSVSNADPSTPPSVTVN